MGKMRKTHVEFVNEIQYKFDGNIVVLGQYTNQTTKIEFCCSECGNQWSAAPMSILKTLVGCPSVQVKLYVKD